MNANIVDDKFPLPLIEELLAEIGYGNGYFVSIDLKAAYHQINLAKECKPLTTVVTHIGTFMDSMMPFGLKTAPNAFQRIMSRVLKGCDDTLVYLDDILIIGKTSEELRIRRVRVERVLNERNVLINEAKSVRETNQVDWLGYKISDIGIRRLKKRQNEFGV